MLRIRHFFRVKKSRRLDRLRSWPDLTSDPRSFAASPRVYAMLCRQDKAIAWDMIRMQKAEGCLIFQACCCSSLAVEGPTAAALILENLLADLNFDSLGH